MWRGCLQSRLSSVGYLLNVSTESAPFVRVRSRVRISHSAIAYCSPPFDRAHHSPPPVPSFQLPPSQTTSRPSHLHQIDHRRNPSDDWPFALSICMCGRRTTSHSQPILLQTHYSRSSLTSKFTLLGNYVLLTFAVTCNSILLIFTLSYFSQSTSSTGSVWVTTTTTTTRPH